MINARIEEASFIVLDFETTGEFTLPYPIELAAKKISPGMVVDPDFEINSFIRPPKTIPVTPFISKLTGINQEDVDDAPLPEQVISSLNDALAGKPAVLVAHHAPFDSSVLKRHIDFCPNAAPAPFLCTVKLSRKLVPGLPSYKLDSVAEAFDIDIPEDRHRAMPDVNITLEALLRLLGIAKEKGYNTVSDLLRISAHSW